MRQRIGRAVVLGCFLVLMCTAGRFAEVAETASAEVVATESDLMEGEALIEENEAVSPFEEGEISALPKAEADSEESPENVLEPVWAAPSEDMVAIAVAEVDHYVNVRREPDVESSIVGKLYSGGIARVLGVAGATEDWYQIISGNVEGYVKGEFLGYEEVPEEEYEKLSEEFSLAATLEEDAARRAAEQKERIPVMQDIVFPDTSYTTNEELRQSIVEYALQYVGNRYVSGGKSLAGGTDCSGFTCFVYSDFGYSISRTPQGQFDSAGHAIDYSQIQPGDIICYSDNGGRSCTHVALYTGDGQIVHSANSRKGVIVGNADYNPIIGIKNVID